MSEIVSAADAALIAATSGSFSVSADNTNAITWVSHLNPSANSGRTGRSIIRLVRISRSLGRPSRLIKPPGYPSPGVGVFAVVDGEREEVNSLPGIRVGYCGGQYDVVADAHHGRAVCLFGDLAGFKFKVLTAGKFDANCCYFWFHDSSF